MMVETPYKAFAATGVNRRVQPTRKDLIEKCNALLLHAVCITGTGTTTKYVHLI
jgi:hypothetical protein